MQIQISALFWASTEKDEGVRNTIPFFADSFAQEVGRYKLLELMLFFSRYRAGRYKTYGKFDPKQIGEAFFGKFVPERERELDELAQQEADARREAALNDPQNMGKDAADTFLPWKRAGYDIARWLQHRKGLATWWRWYAWQYATTLPQYPTFARYEHQNGQGSNLYTNDTKRS